MQDNRDVFLENAGGLLKTQQFAFTVGEQHTEVIMTPFANCIFVVITQLEKIGTMVGTQTCFLVSYSETQTLKSCKLHEIV